MKRHSKVKPFECDICNKRFKHKKSRDKHIRIGKHKQVTDFEQDCDFCDETFTNRKLLLDHFEEIHHKENIINSLDECQDEDIPMDEGEGVEEQEEFGESYSSEHFKFQTDLDVNNALSNEPN